MTPRPANRRANNLAKAVPNVSPGDYALTVQEGSVTVGQTLFITVGN